MKLMLVCLMLIISVSGYAQHIADTFQHAEKSGYAMSALDGQYASALNSDSTKAVFKGKRSEAFIQAYTAMLNDLSKYLNQHKFSWQKPTRIFNRIYFEANGSISYYLVNLQNTGLNAGQAAQFIKLLNQFVKNYKIKIKADSRFAQCSPVVYQNS
jgi:hypothetical protein